MHAAHILLRDLPVTYCDTRVRVCLVLSTTELT